MIDPHNVPLVQEQELLARFVLQSGHIRRSNQTLKPDAFVPHPHRELSVTRHLHATSDELWIVGREVAATIRKTLYGRGDVQAIKCIQEGLRVLAAPVDDNPNHADVSGWPADKPAQKIIAQELSAAATFVARNE